MHAELSLAEISPAVRHDSFKHPRCSILGPRSAFREIRCPSTWRAEIQFRVTTGGPRIRGVEEGKLVKWERARDFSLFRPFYMHNNLYNFRKGKPPKKHNRASLRNFRHLSVQKPCWLMKLHRPFTLFSLVFVCYVNYCIVVVVRPDAGCLKRVVYSAQPVISPNIFHMWITSALPVWFNAIMHLGFSQQSCLKTNQD